MGRTWGAEGSRKGKRPEAGRKVIWPSGWGCSEMSAASGKKQSGAVFDEARVRCGRNILSYRAQWGIGTGSEGLDRLDPATGQAGVETSDDLSAGSGGFAFARFSMAGRLSLRRGDSEAGVDLARQALEQLPDPLRARFLPLAVDLYLAGHTHGGQISFVFPFVQFTPTMFETRYIRGDFWFDNPGKPGTSMLMVVTRGLGMSLAPIRYNSTPEVTLIVLQKSD